MYISMPVCGILFYMRDATHINFLRVLMHVTRVYRLSLSVIYTVYISIVHLHGNGS